MDCLFFLDEKLVLKCCSIDKYTVVFFVNFQSFKQGVNLQYNYNTKLAPFYVWHFS